LNHAKSVRQQLLLQCLALAAAERVIFAAGACREDDDASRGCGGIRDGDEATDGAHARAAHVELLAPLARGALRILRAGRL
jgi:hypothetical protein